MKFLIALLISVSCWAQQAAPAGSGRPALSPESQELTQALAEANNSPVEVIHALEKHLAKYPNSPQKSDIERVIVKAAIETKDQKRLVEYGERVLKREPNDMQVLDKVIRALLSTDDKDTSERALKYSLHYQELLGGMRKEPPPGHMSQTQWQDSVDQGQGRAYACQARATGNLGRIDEAIALARRGYEIYPSAESARELGRWLARAGKNQEAIVPYAEAFAIPDPRNSDGDRAKDRAQLGEIYRKVYGSEKGLGDVVLEAYDNTSGLLSARRLRLREDDPNSLATNIMDFTLSGLDGRKLTLASLKGKAIVFAFWATWCGPCRAQHPEYEQVIQRFHDTPDVVFLSINTDEDRDLVAPFLKEQHWDQQNEYFEDGLSRVLAIRSIPTTIIVDKHGEIVNRMNGFLPGHFVDMLSDRVRDALKN